MVVVPIGVEVVCVHPVGSCRQQQDAGGLSVDAVSTLRTGELDPVTETGLTDGSITSGRFVLNRDVSATSFQVAVDELVINGDLSVDTSITVDANSRLVVNGVLNVPGVVQLGAGAYLEVQGDTILGCLLFGGSQIGRAHV